MNRTEDRSQEELMNSLVAALEARPQIAVPQDFTARLMQRVPQTPSRRYLVSGESTLKRRYGEAALLTALALLLAGMAVLAPLTPRSGVWLSLQLLLFAQFCVLLAVAKRPWRA